MLPAWRGSLFGQCTRSAALACATARRRTVHRCRRTRQGLTAHARRGQRAIASREEAVVDLAELVQNDLGTDVGRKQIDGLAFTERRTRSLYPFLRAVLAL